MSDISPEISQHNTIKLGIQIQQNSNDISNIKTKINANGTLTYEVSPE